MATFEASIENPSSSRAWAMAGITLCIGLLFWFIDSFINAFVFHDGNLLQQLFRPTPVEIGMRSVVLCLLIALAVSTQFILTTRRRTESPVAEQTRLFALDREMGQILNRHQDLQGFYKEAPIGLCTLDTNLRYIHINDWLAALNGLPNEAHLGRTIREVLPDMAAGVEQQLRKVIETGEPIIDGRVDAKTPAHLRVVRNFQHYYYPNRNESGRIVGVSCVVADITEPKRAEEARIRSEKLLGSIINNTTSVIYVKLVDGKYLMINHQFEKLFHTSLEHIRGKTDYDIFPKEIADTFRKNDLKVLNTKALVESEEYAPHEDGLHTYISVKFPLLDERGMPYATCGISTDITMRKMAEDMVTKLNREHQLILASAGEGIYGLDLEGKTTFVNPAAARMIGYESAELIGKPQHAMLHHTKPDGSPYPREECPIYAAFKDGTTYFVDSEVFWRKDGTSFPVEYTSTPIWREGRLAGAVVTFRDITEHQQAENALRASEERFQLAVQGSNDGLWDWNMDTTEVFYSARFKELLGYTKEEFPSQFASFESHLHPEDHAKVMAALRTHLAGTQPYEMECRLRMKSGGYRWFRARGQAVWNKSGQPTRMAGSISDITHSKEVQKELVDKEVWLEKAQTIANVGSWEWDIQTGEERWSNEQFRIFGYPPDSMIPSYNTFLEALHPEDKSEVLAAVEATLSHNLPYHIECRIIRPDKNIRVVECAGEITRDSKGQPVKMVGTVHDITEHKQAERALHESEQKTITALQESDTLKTALLSSISHEIKTPLSAIKVGVSTLTQNGGRVSNAIRDELVGGIIQEVDGLTHLVDNLLDMSRIEAGVLKPKYEAHLFEELIEGAIRRLTTKLMDRKLELDLSPSLQPILLDGVQIQHVLINLLDNAIKYSQEASLIRVHAYVKRKELEIRVVSKGEVIPHQDLTRIFERFYRVPAVRHRLMRGTGLGLSICRGIVEAHGGRILAESSSRDGTTITITLPMRQVKRTIPKVFAEKPV